MMMVEKKPLIRGRDVWRVEIKELFSIMPKDYKQRLIVTNSEYDSLAGAELIKNFKNLVSRDIVLRRHLERVAAEYQAELALQAELSSEPAMPPVRVA